MNTATQSRRRTGPIAWLLIQPIRGYQRFVSRYTPATCRYYPTCSAFAITALRTHGSIKGIILTAWRLLRCNPWSDGGIDHVPDRGYWRGRRDVMSGDGSPSTRADEVRGTQGSVIPLSLPTSRGMATASGTSQSGSTAA